MDLILPSDEVKAREFREREILVDFTKEELRSWTPRGGVLTGCSDDTIDAFAYHRSAVPEVRAIRHFGLPLILIPTFPIYNKGFAKYFFEYMILGMEHKGTKSVFNGFHHPCGIGVANGMTLDKIVFWAAPELFEVYKEWHYFDLKKIFMLFHLKRSKGQKTYRIDLTKL